MSLDRDLQRKILEVCARHYPRPEAAVRIAALCDVRDVAPFNANVAYLTAHGLTECEIRHVNGQTTLGPCTITARGMDFLADDGGLTAILGTVVVKLHADTIRGMLLEKTEESALPEEQKSTLRKQIENLPAAALQAATSRLAQEGLAHIPDLLNWLRSVAGL